MGSHRVGHDWSDLAAAAAATWGLNVALRCLLFSQCDLLKIFFNPLQHFNLLGDVEIFTVMILGDSIYSRGWGLS